MGERFGDLPNNPIMRNVFGGLPGEGEGPPVFDYKGDPLVPIPVLIVPNNFGDPFNNLGNTQFQLADVEPQDGGPPPIERLKWTCMPEVHPGKLDPTTAYNYEPCGDQCFQIPISECGRPVHPLMPTHIRECFDTKEECEQDECCGDPTSVSGDPSGPPITTHMCWEMKASKRLDAQVNIVIERFPGRDIGTADNPDPNNPLGKAYSLKAYIDKYTWTKESIRECLSVVEEGDTVYIKPRTTDIKVGLIVRPTIEEKYHAIHGGPDHPFAGDPFWNDLSEVVDITYDFSFELDINPAACNIGCFDFPSTDEMVFANFCGGKKRKKNATTYIEKVFHTEWANKNGEIYFATQTGLLHFPDRPNAAAAPPGYGLVSNAWLSDQNNPDIPFAVQEAAVMTFKESLVLNLMLNLDNDIYGGQITSFCGLPAPTLLYQSLEQIHDVEYCIGSFNPAPNWMWERITLSTGQNAFMPNDSYFQRKDLNYLFKKFNQYAIVPTDSIGYRLVGGY